MRMVRTTTKSKRAAAAKGGRNADGTFAVGNKPKVTENYGRPPECMSFREQVKIRASKDPSLVDDAINTLIEIANNPNHPKCVDAIDKLIKLNGNYDPAETKSKTELSGSVETVTSSPLAELTRDDLKRLLNE